MASVGEYLNKHWDPRWRADGRPRWIIGDLIFSRQGYGGVVLNVCLARESSDDDIYVIMWTISKDEDMMDWRLSQQTRTTNSLIRKCSY